MSSFKHRGQRPEPPEEKVVSSPCSREWVQKDMYFEWFGMVTSCRFGKYPKLACLHIKSHSNLTYVASLGQIGRRRLPAVSHNARGSQSRRYQQTPWYAVQTRPSCADKTVSSVALILKVLLCGFAFIGSQKRLYVEALSKRIEWCKMLSILLYCGRNQTTHNTRSDVPVWSSQPLVTIADAFEWPGPSHDVVPWRARSLSPSPATETTNVSTPSKTLGLSKAWDDSNPLPLRDVQHQNHQNGKMCHGVMLLFLSGGTTGIGEECVFLYQSGAAVLVWWWWWVAPICWRRLTL